MDQIVNITLAENYVPQPEIQVTQNSRFCISTTETLSLKFMLSSIHSGSKDSC